MALIPPGTSFALSRHHEGQPAPPTEYDLIVLGGGAVGENVADRAGQAGLTAVLIESELVGGECSYWAGMPSKALLRSAQVLRAARQVPGAAQAVTGELDVQAVLKRRDSFASNWSDQGQVRWLESAGIGPSAATAASLDRRRSPSPPMTARRRYSPHATL